MSPGDFFIGCLKNNVLRNHPITMEELKTEIENTVRTVNENMVHGVFKNLIRCLNTCLEINGGQFQHVLSKFLAYGFSQFLNFSLALLFGHVVVQFRET